MLSGEFKNCYGIKEFSLPAINFNSCNKAIIYAPNGVMKTSLARVFEDVSKGKQTKERIFKKVKSCYRINYYSSKYSNDKLEPTDNIYVINSFSEKFELPKETMTTLLADEKTRKEYDLLVSEFSEHVGKFEENIYLLSGIPKQKIKSILHEDLNLDENADWTDIFQQLTELNVNYKNSEILKGIKYSELFNAKTIEVYKDTTFKAAIGKYIDLLNELISDNELLSLGFDDYNAGELAKSFEKHNLFNAKHSVVLKDGETQIKSIAAWNNIVKAQLEKVYSEPELSKEFNVLKTMLTKNAEVRTLRDIIISNRSIISYLKEPDELKGLLWVHYLHELKNGFSYYSEKIIAYSEKVKGLYETAEKQAERWRDAVSEFNRRFKVPFEIKIFNKANFLLKDEAPNLFFTYTRCKGTGSEESENYGKEDLMPMLSTGERRAMYLLYVLFDLERVKLQAAEGSGKYLIIADDIADSFDYKNKYAIIEYLFDLAQSQNIDLLILTHNFDFYRNVMLRLDIVRENCYIVQKNEDLNELYISEFKYKNDFFKKVLTEEIQNGNIDSKDKKKKLIASIPFYRNLCEYIVGTETEKEKLTCLLHIKKEPLDTSSAKILDVWDSIPNIFRGSNSNFSGCNEKYLLVIDEIAQEICENPVEEIKLENKIFLSIAIRLKSEEFLKEVLDTNGEETICSKNQTRVWSTRAAKHLNEKQNAILNEVNLMTAEGIHLNSFMYEPIIDMSDWALKKLYREVKSIREL